MFTNTRKNIIRAIEFVNILESLPCTRGEIWKDSNGRIFCKNKDVAALVKNLLEIVYEESVSVSNKNGISVIHALDETTEFSNGNFEPLTMEQIMEKLPTDPGEIWFDECCFQCCICCKSDEVAEFLWRVISHITEEDVRIFFDGDYWNILIAENEEE